MKTTAAMRRANILYAPYGFKPETIFVKEGSEVEAGDQICSIVGMDEFITTPVSGKISRIYIKPNELVSWDRALVTMAIASAAGG